MKKSKFTESQIIGILKEQEQGKKVSDLCREYGISQPTFYQWKSKYSGLDVNQLKRVKELEAEVSRYLAGFFEQVKSRDFLTLTIQNSHEEDQIHRSPDHWDLERTGIRPESV